jgi:hypothetical protein
MGWVENRFLDEVAYSREIPKLWNKVRDSLGQSASEFNARIKSVGPEVSITDCMAKGKLCVRLQRDESTIEIFLNASERALKTYTPNSPDKTVAHFRLTPARDELEFFVERDGITIGISVDGICELAVASFLFDPFPRRFNAEPQLL